MNSDLAKAVRIAQRDADTMGKQMMVCRFNNCGFYVVLCHDAKLLDSPALVRVIAPAN